MQRMMWRLEVQRLNWQITKVVDVDRKSVRSACDEPCTGVLGSSLVEVGGDIGCTACLADVQATALAQHGVYDCMQYCAIAGASTNLS